MEKKLLKIEVFEDKILKRYFKYSLFLISLSLIFIVFKFKTIPPKIPLFYSLPWGEQQLADKFFLFLLPIASIITLLLNIILAKKIKEEVLVMKLLIGTAFLFSLLSFITLVKIILLIA